MRIITPTEIEHVAWEGHLKPLAESFKGAESLPRVTLGEPAWWAALRQAQDAAEQAMEGETGKKCPPGDRCYTLLRLACTLHPPAEARARYIETTLTTVR